jgi:disease resistance protein RPM1
MQQDLMKSLSNLHKLESLHIVALHVGPASMHEGWVPPPQLRILHLDKAFKSLPSWISPTLFPLLSYLLIKVRKLHPEDFRLLGMLPALRFLHFERISFFGTIETEDDAVEMLVVTVGAFPCARKLRLPGVLVMPSTFPRGAAPRLKYVTFASGAMQIAGGDCDWDMGHLPSLETFELETIQPFGGG